MIASWQSPGPAAIEPLGLLLAAGFVAVVLGVSALLRLGFVRTVLVAAVRCYLQLMLLGYALVYLFAWDHPLATGGVYGLMILFSAHTVMSRLRQVPVPVFGPVLLALAASGLLITLAVTGLIIQGLEPFWQARYWLTIGGMVLGNSITGIALAVERLYADLIQRREAVRTIVALGATPAEAMRASVRTGLRAGLTPIINNMAAVGVVSIPGMMAGQVLAGADPGGAARYQIVVMLMIAAATALGASGAVLLCARRAFDADGAPRELETPER